MPQPHFAPLRVVCVVAAFAALTACARTRVTLAPVAEASDAAARAQPAAAAAGPCVGCEREATSDDVIRAVALRVAALKARGGACQAYGSVLEGSLAAGRVIVRPFMWRVGRNLASAQALSSGEIDVAREVDALNIGVRSLDDVVRSIEHEAAHIAFAIPSGQEWTEMVVDERVGECRGPGARRGSAP